MNQEIRKIWTLAEPYVNDAGFDLVEVQSGREAGGWVVRLFIDRRPPVAGAIDVDAAADALLSEGDAGGGGGGVSLENCERVSRDVSAALDVADLIPHAYSLEVSSPGLDRPLRREQDFARFAGQKARVRLLDGQLAGQAGQQGEKARRNFSGIIRGAKDGSVEIECDGRSYQILIENIAKANLVPDWDSEFKRSAS